MSFAGVDREPSPWWRGAVGYEVYVRSFADNDGDGIGDLRGITQHLDYLSHLGVDAVWITPFYPSPGFDHGYDVSDYEDVNPIHGTLADFDALVDRAHRLGLRVVIDIVTNHSSSLHPWFVEARRGPDNPYRDFYIWKDPAPDGGPPNNWVSHFGGPAWTRDEASGQYYLHLFLPEQPDLNWENERVRAQVDDVLRFWCERGVDGFRIDVAHCFTKDQTFAPNPQRRPLQAGMSNWEVWNSFDHRHDLDQDRNVGIFRRWNRVVKPYGALLVGEVALADPRRVARYTRDGDGLHTAFFLQPPKLNWVPEELLAQTRAMHDADSDRVAWVVDNHDQSRSVTRFGGGSRGARRSLALTTLYCALDGMPFLYQGQELGLEDGVVERAADPIALRNVDSTGRDGCRTVMPWEPGPGNGFTSGEPWLRAELRGPPETVAGQEGDPASWLSRHRDLLRVRRRHPDLWRAPARWLETERAGTAALVRGRAGVVANLSPEAGTVDLPTPDWHVVFASFGRPVLKGGDRLEVPAEATVILATHEGEARADTS